MQNGRKTWFKLLGWQISYCVHISPIMEFMWMSWCWFRGKLWASFVSCVCMFALRHLSFPPSVSAPTHQGGDSHHLPPGKWQSAEASPKKESIASANLLVSTLFAVVLEDAECIRKWKLETIKAAPQSTYPGELVVTHVVIHATPVLYSINGKWRDFRQDFRKDFGRMIYVF